jgi:putative transposase
MPWRTETQMEQRQQLAILAKTGEFTITELSQRFGVSRRTAHKWIDRFEREGLDGLADRHRAPKNSPQKTANAIEEIITAERRLHPTWGPKKLHELLRRDHGIEVPPARSTIGEVLKRHGLSKPKRRRPGIYPAQRGTLTEPERPNQVWCTDHKGWFLLGDGSRCIPLTITDLHSRYVIGIEADEVSTQASAQAGFVKAFRTFGLPEIIRVDNGSPFASMGPGRLSKLSVWWMLHGISVEFTRPGCPQDNGSHERMHETLKAECCKPASANMRAQQKRFDNWKEEFNTVRPHETLGMRVPNDVYRVSNKRQDERIKARLYEPGDEVLKVSSSGTIYLEGRNFHLGDALQNATVALDRDPENGLIAVRFANVKLGEYKMDQKEPRLMYPGYYAEPRNRK